MFQFPVGDPTPIVAWRMMGARRRCLPVQHFEAPSPSQANDKPCPSTHGFFRQMACPAPRARCGAADGGYIFRRIDRRRAGRYAVTTLRFTFDSDLARCGIPRAAASIFSFANSTAFSCKKRARKDPVPRFPASFLLSERKNQWEGRSNFSKSMLAFGEWMLEFLVSRIRSSPHFAAASFANFGFERTLENYESSVVSVQKFS